MYRFPLFCLLCLQFVSFSIVAQNYSDIWNKLSDVRFETIQKNGYEVDKPIFGTKVKNLEGKL